MSEGSSRPGPPHGAVAAVCVAGGEGARLGSGQPKALVPLAGVALVARAAAGLRAAASIGRLIVVAPEGHEDAVAAACADHGAPADAVVTGGATRTASVAAGVAACGPDVATVAIHDAARALVSAELVDRVVAGLVPPWDAVAPGLPVTDTVKLVDPDFDADGGVAVQRTVDRRTLWTVQTPQVMSRRLAEQVLARLGPHGVTDDLSLVERAGGRVRLLPGEPGNVKITGPHDLRAAEQRLAGPAPTRHPAGPPR